MIVFPNFLDLEKSVASELVTGPQFGRPEATGAFSGDVSLKMAKDLGCTFALCGHSDRRLFHHETDEDVAGQVIAALELGLHPVVCVGETGKERKAGKAEEVVKAQLKVLPLESDITIAYEPVWAISRGDPNVPACTDEDAQKMHAFIRSVLPKDRRESTRILYGGSMNALNCTGLLQQSDIDGGLVGGASLKPKEFKEIIDSALVIEEK